MQVHLSPVSQDPVRPNSDEGCSAPEEARSHPVLPSFGELERGKVTLFHRRSNWKIPHHEFEHQHSICEPFAIFGRIGFHLLSPSAFRRFSACLLPQWFPELLGRFAVLT